MKQPREYCSCGKQGTVGRWRAGAGTLTGCIMLTRYICCGSNSVQLHALTLLQNLTDTNPAIQQFLSLSLCQRLSTELTSILLSGNHCEDITLLKLLTHVCFLSMAPPWSLCWHHQYFQCVHPLLTDVFCKDPQRLHDCATDVLLGDPLPVTLQFVKT